MESPDATADVTVEWLNEVLHENGFLNNSNIVSLAHEQIGVGEGFMSDIARLNLEYDIENELPKSIVVKLPTSYPSARKLGIENNTYEKEIRFYSEVAPKIPVRTPELIYSHIDKEKQDYVLIIRDYSNCEKLEMATGANKAQATLIITKLAGFHARWWDADDLFSFPWMPKPGVANTELSADRFKNMVDFCSQIRGFEDFFPSNSWDICLKASDQFRRLVHTARKRNLTMMHCDFRIGNMFLDKDTPDNPLIVYDWSGVCVGVGVGDLSYFLGWSLTTETRREIEQEMLNLYWGTLRSLVAFNYSRKEFISDYRKGLLIFTVIPLLAFTQLDLSSIGSRHGDTYRKAMHRWFDTLLDNDVESVLS